MKNKPEHEERYDKNNEPISISKVTMDMLLKEKDPSAVIALYSFYYYTAKWQEKIVEFKSDRAYATNGYVAKGLHWAIKKVIKNKQVLERLGLIKILVKCDDKTGLIKGHFIKVMFYWCSPKPQCRLDHSVDLGYTNSEEALILNSEEALNKIPVGDVQSDSLIKADPQLEDSPPKPAPVAVVDKNKGWSSKIMSIWHKNIGHLTPWKLKLFKPLVLEHGIDRVAQSLEAYIKGTEVKFVSPDRFCETFNQWSAGSKRKEWYDNPDRYASPSRQ